MTDKKPFTFTNKTSEPWAQSSPSRYVVTFSNTNSGEEHWHIVTSTQIYNLTTTASSARVMDDAVKLYSNALERLAKK